MAQRKKDSDSGEKSLKKYLRVAPKQLKLIDKGLTEIEREARALLRKGERKAKAA